MFYQTCKHKISLSVFTRTSPSPQCLDVHDWQPGAEVCRLHGSWRWCGLLSWWACPPHWSVLPYMPSGGDWNHDHLCNEQRMKCRFLYNILDFGQIKRKRKIGNLKKNTDFPLTFKRFSVLWRLQRILAKKQNRKDQGAHRISQEQIGQSWLISNTLSSISFK